MTTLKTACSRLPRLATSRPLGERSEPSLPAKRPTTPYEIRRRFFFESLQTSSSKRIQKSVGFWIPGRRFRIHGTDSGFFFSGTWIRDSNRLGDSRFQKEKFPGSRLPFMGREKLCFLPDE